MRIPSAWTEGLGQKVTRLQAVAAPDFETGDRIGAAAQRLGDTIADVADKKATTILNEAERKERLQSESEARAALFTHQNQVEQAAKEIAGREDLNPDDKRKEFAAKSDELRESFSGSVPEDYRFSFGPAFDQHRYQAGEQLNTILGKQATDATRAAGMQAREQLLASNRPLSEKLQILKDPDAWDFEAEGLTEAQHQIELQRLTEEATGAEIESRLNQEDPRKVLIDLRATSGEDGNFAQYNALPPKTRQAYVRTAKAAIEAQDREAERRQHEAKQQRDLLAKEMFGGYKTAREALLPVPAAAEAAMWKAVAGTPYEDQAREVRKRTGGLDYVAEKIKADPLTYGAAQLGLQIPPLAVENPADWPAQIAARAQVAEVVRAGHGLSYSPLLTNSEADAITGLFKTQTPQAQVSFLQGIGQMADKNTMRQLATQFAATDKDLGTVAALMADGKAQAAYHVANGRRLADEKAVPLPKPLTDDMRSRFDNHLDDALAGMPQAREALMRATQSAYLSIRGAGAVVDENLNKAAFDQALELVAGQTAKVNGKRVLLPEGVSEDQLLDTIKKIDADKVTAAGGVYGFKTAAAAAEDILDDAELYETGSGRFRFVIDGRFLVRADDPAKYFELDLTGAQ